MHGVEIIELICIAIAAFAMAGDEALRHTPNLAGTLPRLRGSWRFLPAALVSFAALLFIAQLFGLPNIAGVLISIFVFGVLGIILFRTSSKTSGPGKTLLQATPDNEFPTRIFQFRSDVNLDRLDEFQISLQFLFYNGSDESITIETVTGSIRCNGSFDVQLPPPHVDVDHPVAGAGPRAQFTVGIEQRVPKELAPLLNQKLNAGMPISFELTGLTLRFRRSSGGESFAANLWDGIMCSKKEVVVCGRIVQATGAMMRGEGSSRV
jgi:hypothetical protein